MQDQATVDVQLALPTSISMEETKFSQLNFLHVWIKPELGSSLVQTQNIQFGSSALLSPDTSGTHSSPFQFYSAESQVITTNNNILSPVQRKICHPFQNSLIIYPFQSGTYKVYILICTYRV